MELMDWKVSRIITNTVMFLHGTVYKDKKYIDQFDYKTKFRLLPAQFGIYGGEKVFEFEEVGISTNAMTFEEVRFQASLRNRSSLSFSVNWK